MSDAASGLIKRGRRKIWYLLPLEFRRRMFRALNISWDAWLGTLLGVVPLPRRLVWAACRWASWFSVRYTKKGRAMTLHLGAALGLDGRARPAAARRWMELNMRNRAMVYRMARGLDDGLGIKIVVRNPEVAVELRSQGRSVLATSAHFLQSTMIIPFRGREEEQGWGFGIRGAVPHGALDRVSTLGASAQDALHAIAGRGSALAGGDFYENSIGAVRVMIEHLRRPGSWFLLGIDAAPVTPNALRRPFATVEDLPYYTGAPRIARLTGCVILPLGTSWGEHDEVIMEWGQPIEAPARGEDETLLLDRVLDQVEILVGRHYLSYDNPYTQLHKPVRRRWNAQSERWEPLPQADREG